MNTKTCYSYDEDFVYSGITIAYESPLEPNNYLLPANAVWVEPPICSKPYVPVWSGNDWILIQDHRQHLNDKGTLDGGTPYWLPEDDWQSEPRYIKELGELPVNALLSRPTKSQVLIEKEKLEQEISEAKAYLSDTDYITLKIIEEPETRYLYEEQLQKRKEMRAKIDPLQAQITALNL